MKYLKPFNESINPDEFEELKDFCETSLINLIDRDTSKDDFVLFYTKLGANVDPSITNDSIKVELLGPLSDEERERLSTWCWNDVKDSYIPFLKMLVKRYKLAANYVDFKFRTTRSRYEMSDKSFRIEDVINDRIDLDKSNLFSISVKIIGKI